VRNELSGGRICVHGGGAGEGKLRWFDVAGCVAVAVLLAPPVHVGFPDRWMIFVRGSWMIFVDMDEGLAEGGVVVGRKGNGEVKILLR